MLESSKDPFSSGTGSVFDDLGTFASCTMTPGEEHIQARNPRPPAQKLHENENGNKERDPTFDYADRPTDTVQKNVTKNSTNEGDSAFDDADRPPAIVAKTTESQGFLHVQQQSSPNREQEVAVQKLAATLDRMSEQYFKVESRAHDAELRAKAAETALAAERANRAQATEQAEQARLAKEAEAAAEALRLKQAKEAEAERTRRAEAAAEELRLKQAEQQARLAREKETEDARKAEQSIAAQRALGFGYNI